MAYQATVLQLLISCPGDVDAEDLAVVRRAVTRWNVLQGESFEHVVIPVSWSEDAAAEFGGPPQEIVNRQLVDVVDMGVAIFWNRLGTPTDTAESGTAEEIVKLHDAGKPVSVLRCTKPVPPSGDHTERARLDEYFQQEIQPRGLVVNYDTSGGLERQVDTILTRLVRRHERDWEVSTPQGRRGGPQVVATTRRERVTKHNSKGKAQDSTKYYVKFANIGGTQASDIEWRFKPIADIEGELPSIGAAGAEGSIPSLSPSGEVEYQLLPHMGSAHQFLCQISWQDGDQTRCSETTLSP